MTSNPTDARFCPSCGEELPEWAVEFYGDLVLGRYRARLVCPSCGYHGEVFRHGVEVETGPHRTDLAGPPP